MPVYCWVWFVLTSACLVETCYYAATAQWYRAFDKFFHLLVAMFILGRAMHAMKMAQLARSLSRPKVESPPASKETAP